MWKIVKNKFGEKLMDKWLLVLASKSILVSGPVNTRARIFVI
jgi:hypothetical protein